MYQLKLKHCVSSVYKKILGFSSAKRTCKVSKASLFCSGCKISRDGQQTVGDVIVQVGMQEVESTEDFVDILKQFSVGDLVPITVKRGKKFKKRIPILVPFLHVAECTSKLPYRGPDCLLV